jgi:hypothetical protein
MEMATIAKENVRIHARKRSVQAKTKPDATETCVEVRLSDRDRDILLAALHSTRPNLPLLAAAEKYKKQCA